MLVCHGGDDQIVPIDAASKHAAELLPNAELKVYDGAPHGISGAYEESLNRDLLAFVESCSSAAPEGLGGVAAIEPAAREFASRPLNRLANHHRRFRSADVDERTGDRFPSGRSPAVSSVQRIGPR